ncbi:hypothetical protein [Psychrobacter glacincola]|uniref:hypothetical protein n=1 Tax=Psychrobacter glacincola TaxID=56810 RepID=UPI0039AF73D0
MKSQKMRPLPNKASSKKTTKTANFNKPRPKWWFGILLIVLLVGYLVWKSMASQPNYTTAENLPVTSEQDEPTRIASVPLEDDVRDVINDENQDSANITDSNISNPKAILEAPLPETDSLAKEEIDRLEDERKRLVEQEKLAAEQITMTKKLTELKAEEIALLEQQIAQLEIDTAAKMEAK